MEKMGKRWEKMGRRAGCGGINGSLPYGYGKSTSAKDRGGLRRIRGRLMTDRAVRIKIVPFLEILLPQNRDHAQPPHFPRTGQSQSRISEVTIQRRLGLTWASILQRYMYKTTSPTIAYFVLSMMGK